MYRRMKTMTDKTFLGIVGTAVGSVGAGLSVTELQAIISIIVTIAGFCISVLAPLIIKLIKKIKKAREDGKIDKEELNDILDTGKEIVDETGKVIDEIKNKD